MLVPVLKRRFWSILGESELKKCSFTVVNSAFFNSDSPNLGSKSAFQDRNYASSLKRGGSIELTATAMKLATLCYLKKNAKTLMMRRNKRTDDIHFGKWNGLGGKLEPGETPEECVIREVLEESGLCIQQPRLVGLLTFPDFKDDEDWYVYVYTAYSFSGNLQECAEGVMEWIDDAEILDLPLWEGDRHFLRWIEEKKFFSGKFVYKEKVLVHFSAVFHW